MDRKTNHNQEATNIVPQPTQKDNPTPFDALKRAYETAYASGADYSAQLYDLATAVTYSVINKCLDPQRKTAPQRDTVSNNGRNPALVTLRQGIAHDLHTLAATRDTADRATHTTHNADGDTVTTTADKDAAEALARLIDATLSDGIDLVHTAALALLEQSAAHADGPTWLDSPYTVRRLDKRVYIRLDDSAAYKDTDTTPIQEVFRAVRQAVQASRAVQADPRNGYSYIDDTTPDGLDAIYYRLHKYADLGGYDTTGHYTTDKHTVRTAAEFAARLRLTDRQAQVLRLRLQGKGYKAIATYLGVCNNAIVKTVKQIQAKALEEGLISPEE